MALSLSVVRLKTIRKGAVAFVVAISYRRFTWRERAAVH
jgi:hypothetical protein